MSLMIALPCHGGIVSEKTTMSLFNLGKLLVRNNIPHGLLTQANSSLITQGRSKCANFFINNTEHEYLFFLDSDIGFNPENVLKLLFHNVDIVSGAYPMKTIPIRYCFDIIQPEERKGDLIKVEGNGMGFVMIHRNVFLNMAKNFPDLKYTPPSNDSNVLPTPSELNNSYHFFMEHKLNDSFMSEDKSFFYRARMMGYDVWLDTTIKLQHVGSHIFTE
jgi:glycosyltransferase involved in cell wall biosynthesis